MAGHEVQDASRLLHLLQPVRHSFDMELHQLANQRVAVPTGQRVVADISNAKRVQAVAAPTEQGGLGGRRQPGIDPMGQDEIESAQAGGRHLGHLGHIGKIGNIRAKKLDIAQPQFGLRAPGLRNLHRRIIESDKTGGWQGRRHRQQVAATGAADFEHPGARQGRHFPAEQRGDDRQPVRMRSGKSKIFVQRFVVGVGGHGGGASGSDGEILPRRETEVGSFQPCRLDPNQSFCGQPHKLIIFT